MSTENTFPGYDIGCLIAKRAYCSVGCFEKALESVMAPAPPPWGEELCSRLHCNVSQTFCSGSGDREDLVQIPESAGEAFMT